MSNIVYVKFKSKHSPHYRIDKYKIDNGVLYELTGAFWDKSICDTYDKSIYNFILNKSISSAETKTFICEKVSKEEYDWHNIK